MNLSDEFDKLADQHQRGVLNDAEFAAAKARLLAQPAASARPAAAASSVQALNGLFRSREDRWLGGVCGGLAQVWGLPAWFWRLAFTVLVLCAGTGLALYVLLWIFVPEDPSSRSTAHFAG